MARKKSGQQQAFEEQIESQAYLEYVRNAMTIYGSYTLESRAIPDFRDGLKPVHRRILWSSYELGLLASKDVQKKSARIVGDVLGKYHPHGDTAVYDALVAMTWLKQPVMYGMGNFGNWIDSPAAMRYTEARLSRYADLVMFDPFYTPTIQTVDNFDSTEQEPVVLPSLLPNLLVNGMFGIATGGRCVTPAFELEGVVKLIKTAFTKKVTVKDCVKFLTPTCPEGGVAYLEEPEYVKELERFFATGDGSIYWIPKADYDIPNRSITLSGFAPSQIKGLAKTLNDLSNDEDVSDVIDQSDIDSETGRGDLVYKVILKKSIPKEDVEEMLVAVQEYFEASQSLGIAVTERVKNEHLVDVSFTYTNIPDLLNKWCDWRIQLERDALTHWITVNERKLAREELMLLAVLNRDIIIKALDSDDPAKVIMTKLKITIDQANAILDLRVRQLKKLDEAPIRKRIAELKAEIKQMKLDHKTPVPRIIKGLDELYNKLEGV